MDNKLENNVLVKLKSVSKIYKLYPNKSDRMKAAFSKKVKYVEKKALTDINLDIYRGESVAFLGKNGAGKSTMLKLITGVSYPTSGFLRVNGRVCALLELTAGFDLEQTGRENIYLKAGIIGIPNSEIREIEEAVIAFSELGPYIDQPVRTYSSGMRSRLGFAININMDPDVLIVDEALSVGDAEFRKKCRKRIQEMCDNGVTLLLVTHSMDEARQFCKRGVVLRNGHIVCDAAIGEAVRYYSRRILLQKPKQAPMNAKPAAADTDEAAAPSPAAEAEASEVYAEDYAEPAESDVPDADSGDMPETCTEEGATESEAADIPEAPEDAAPVGGLSEKESGGTDSVS